MPFLILFSPSLGKGGFGKKGLGFINLEVGGD